jgi:DNA-binding response OmpR family regulator
VRSSGILQRVNSDETLHNVEVESARILLVEDADAIRVAVEAALVAHGHVVLGRPHGATLEQDLARFRPDVVVLDVMLPGRDGFDLLVVVRARSNAGVVMLTARDGVVDRLRGLQTGADDYITKPFVLAELIARIEALLRRMGRLQSITTVGDLVIDLNAKTVRRVGEPILLTMTEFKLLAYLALHRDEVLTKNQLLVAVWGYDAYDENLVEVYVSSIRRKLEAHGPRLLHTVRGRGYTLRVEP